MSLKERISSIFRVFEKREKEREEGRGYLLMIAIDWNTCGFCERMKDSNKDRGMCEEFLAYNDDNN